jgi:hypothetical protein
MSIVVVSIACKVTGMFAVENIRFETPYAAV